MEFRLLGGIEAHGSGEPVDLGPARQQTVLAALLMDVNRTVATDQLVYRVWGEDPARRARDTLYSYLSRLRGVLPRAGVDISRRSGGYAVVTDALAVDVHRFRHLLEKAHRAADDRAAAAAFQEALAVWRGTPFAGVDTPWFNAAREALSRERLAAELDCVDVRLRLGEHTVLLPALSDRSAAHPLDERLAAQYMVALYRCGRQADALAHYRRVRATLAQELGIDPGTELQRLHQAILSGSPELNPQPAAPPIAAAPVRNTSEVAWTVQCQLPLDAPGFVGRAAVIRRLEEELTAAATVPVILSGSPGVGKTALAVHLCHRLRAAFPDGQWYVRLSGTGDRPRDPAEVLSALLRTCGQEPHTIPEPLEDRAAVFRGRLADRKVLLVLDNAADAEQVRPLLPGTTGVAVLVTSRSDLRGLTASHAARTTPLDVLAPAEARALLASTLGAQRVGDEPEAAERLAELCARLPLALRIAAANLAARPGRSLTGYATELAADGRLTKLSVTGDRQAAVRTAFDHSYAALEPDTAHLFALLGLHPGPDFTAEAAAALIASPIGVAERLLDQLTTAGLVQHTASDRFQFHDLLRLYAAEHAAADPGQAAAWRRLCDWYLATADAATAFGYTGIVQLPRTRVESTRFDDRHQALAWLESERANLVAVITHAAEAGPHRIAWQLADQLRPYFYRRRHQTEWEAAMTAGLRAAEHEGEALAQAAMQHGFFLLRQHAGDIQAALEAVHLALEGYRRTGFTSGEGAILTNLALHYGQRGQMRHALDWMEKSIAIARSLGRPIQVGRGLNMAGLIHSYLGELDRALERTTEAIETYLKAGHQSLTISPRINRAIAHHALGQYEEALADGTEALRLCHSHQQRHSVAGAHELLARVYRDTGQTDLAYTHAEQALQRARETGDPANETDSLITLGSLHRLRCRLDLALARLEEALTITCRCDFRHQEAEVNAQLAHAHLASGSAPTATHHAHQALALARALDLRPAEHRALTALAAIAHTTGTPAEAADHTAQAQRIQNETRYHPSPADEPQVTHFPGPAATGSGS
ncbi:transcriptional regulator, SARP family protein [Streptomyces qaidamensis]|uniref:Transcriptional regulator, SARP family protein n=1 Tax=Streptomyces qaidamensis TaxID=1783515 RepID=A0A143CCA5_9ACTN|nr:BTAD domain-containing putative transcriptional regulator [Streptomyces qaidamensis]AMW15063.1 transcriptional regulator, SARP family protein [Streptomyces qaidamensis]